MKILKQTGFLFTLGVIVLSACKKDKPVSELFFKYQFEVQLPSGESQNAVPGAYALITVKNKNNQEVITDRKVLLKLTENKYVTEKLELPAGNYRLTKFIVNSNTDVTRFATPVAGSDKATLVSQPLSIGFKVPNATVLNIPVQVLKVEASHTPGQYGYPAGTFNQPSVNPEDHFKIKVRAVLSIGDVIYDSVPALFRITTWKSATEFAYKDTLMDAGVAEVAVSKAAVKYTVKLMKWGIVDELDIMRTEVDEAMVYILGGAKNAKKLKEEVIYSFNNNTYKLHEKKAFTYDASGRLQEILYYSADPNGTFIYDYKEVFVHNGNQVKSYDVYGGGTSEHYRYSVFTLDYQERAIQSEYKYMTEHYRFQNTFSSQGILMEALDDNNQTTGTRVELKIAAGNRVEQKWIATGGVTQRTGYLFDLNINPYRHMKWHDDYFSNISKNNITEEGGFNAAGTFQPIARHEYVYDSDGFLSERIRKTRIANTSNFEIKTKTLYFYH